MPSHEWVYRRPNDRTCRVCRRHELHVESATGEAWIDIVKGDELAHGGHLWEAAMFVVLTSVFITSML